MDIQTLSILTFLECAYLLYMYFWYSTTYSFGEGTYDKATQSLGSFFIHDTGNYENKVCGFGKVVAIFAVLLAVYRVYILSRCSDCVFSVRVWSILFELICCSMAYLMNLNAFFYIMPIAFVEFYILSNLDNFLQ